MVGIGVNCVHAPEGVGYPTATLQRDDGRAIGAFDLFERLMQRFDESLDLWAEGDGFAAIRDGLARRARPESARLCGSTPSRGRREGAFEGLDADGRLLFRGAGGLEAIEAADLWISPAPEGGPLVAPPGSLVREGPA